MEMHETVVLEQTLEDPTSGGCGELEPWVCRACDPSPTESAGDRLPVLLKFLFLSDQV